ncbi:endoplasmic reticulum membrane-associated RNA degradation protein isoform X2 [Ambystoma mexicanum]|uniref:endoplasmic reticulum membrane-associated RNA degradation protein isoform X2 n=1 Tax=Ambystoma mexicanum TaxID=8296 RepID=UPI0037E8D00A
MDPAPTCLSESVRTMVCELGFALEESCDISSIILEDGTVCWEAITTCLCYAGSGEQNVDYAESVKLLGPLCESVDQYLQSLTLEEFEEQYGSYIQWTNNAWLFLDAFDVLKKWQLEQIALSLMKVTSSLERALGDVYLLIGRECPFLLRDLLASLELAVIFGQPVMNVLRVFLGSPESLNLRNLLWHGFAAPREIPSKYCSMLLLLTVGLGQLLKIYHMPLKASLTHRPYLTFSNLKEIDFFSDVEEETLVAAEQLVKESSFVLKSMQPFWTSSLTAFKEGRYADCVILLLPQLETGLRIVFTTVNNCPSRLLTAESATLYTTFDEILSKQLSEEEDNKVPETLGEPVMDFLWDFLNYQDGPRVRDHLSHGEINLKEFPKAMANQILSFSIVLLQRFLQTESKVVDCANSVDSWSQLPVAPVESDQKSSRLDENTGLPIYYPEIAGILSLIQRRMPSDCCTTVHTEDCLLTEMWLQSLVALCNRPMRTLYSPRPVLEAVVVLRKICIQCHLVSSQVISTSELRYKQWMKKELRSRQRHNYLRMFKSVAFISDVLRLILMLITLELSHTYVICTRNSSEFQQYLKYLRLILQYTENLATYTNPEKNKWEESIGLTHGILLKIKMFNEKCEH